MRMPSLHERERRHIEAMERQPGPDAVAAPVQRLAVPADELGTLLAEATNGTPPEDSRLAPLSPAQLEARLELGREVAAAARLGQIVEIPPEMV